ncbi:hypothetical protein ABT127_02770 [Streptomyces sp. NPDC001904]|uniref:hypothetical protein n=1 Tax=Streptomyces sp. NPDC001904 TaxID=3154531 RepID=UPI003332BD91
MKHLRSVAWAGITVAALTATTACSADTARKTADAVGHAGSVMAALTRASDKASGFGSAEVETTTAIQATGGKPISMDGTYSWGDGAALDVEMDTVAANMQALQDDPTLTMKMVDGAYYYEVDPQPRGPLKGKHWVRVDVSAVAGKAGAENMDTNADPTAGLKYLGTSRNVKDLGSRTVRGKRVTHYRGTVGAEQIERSKMTPEEKKLARKAFALGGGKLTYDVWVDGRDLPVRMIQDGGGMRVTMDFVKFGATKPITAPPAADTVDVTRQIEKQRAAALGAQ